MSQTIAHSVAKNTTIQLGQQVMTWASSFLLMLFLPRYLGPVSYGHIYLATTISGIFLMVIDYDGRLGIAKRIARAPGETPTILANSFAFRVFFWLGAFIIMMTFTMAAHYPAVIRWLVFLFGLEMLWCGGRTVLLGLFLGFESLQYSSIGAIVERAFVSLVGIIALLLGANEIVIAIIMISGTLLNFSILVAFARRFTTSLAAIRWSETRLLIKEGFPYLLWSVFGTIYYRIDTVMLSMYTPEAVVGWYGASYRFLDVLSFVPSIFSVSLLPVLSKLQGSSDNLLQRTTQKSLDFIMIAVFPISLCMFALSAHIIHFFYGISQYQPSVVNLQIFTIGLPLIYIDMVLGTALFACDKQKQWAATAFFAALFNIGLNYFLIPLFEIKAGNGGIGAAIATLATEFFVLVNAIYLLPDGVLQRSVSPVALKAIAAGIVLAGVLGAGTVFGIPWFIQPVIGVAIYGAILLLLRAFSPTELEFIRKFFSVGALKNTFAFRKSDQA
jgi:O-antigen/teichoic acid export membrane protein